MKKAIVNLAFAIVLGLVALLFIPITLKLFSVVFSKIPSLPSIESTSSQGSVYERINPAITPDISLKQNDIVEVVTTNESMSEINSPYSQISFFTSIDKNVLFGGLSLFILLCLICFLLVVLKRHSNHSIANYSSQFLIQFGFLVLSAPIILFSLRSTWDEVFAFASQASNFAKSGIWGVWTTGPTKFSESSADTLLTLWGGIIFKFLPAINGEIAILVSLLSLELFSSVAISVMLTRYLKINYLIAGLFSGSIILLFPQTLLTTSANIPSGLASAALAVLLVGFLATLKSGMLHPFIISAIFASMVRWEYGVLSIAAGIISFAVNLINEKKIKPINYWLIATPFVFFIFTSVFRILIFDSFAPSGVLYKSQGFDGGYMRSGFTYLANTAEINYWPFVITFCIFSSIAIAKSQKEKITYIGAFVIALLPLINSIIAGGDWFDLAYARYTLPSLIACIFIAFVAINSKSLTFAGRRIFTFALLATVLITQLPSAKIVSQNISSQQLWGRTNCLAEGAQLVAPYLPEGSGIASAEVNTVAYFAKQPLTDLSGLVDKRVATSKLSPPVPGDVNHRKTVLTMVEDDNPGAIYLFEGSVCDSVTEDDVNEWNILINAWVTRYRAGSPNKLFEEYQPVTFNTPEGHAHRYLVRRDLNIAK